MSTAVTPLAGTLREFSRPTRKTVYTLRIGDYAPQICELTFPLIQHWASKIGAAFEVITERRFPEWPLTYEKLQIHELAKANRDEWAIFVDADTLINPEFFDVTAVLSKDTVAHNGKDFNAIRWAVGNDPYFRRDGRWIGSCTWFIVASEWCLDLYRPLDDLTLEEALARIHITVGEHNSGHCRPDHLIDDFTCSRNIARFGLKFRTFCEMCGELGYRLPNGMGFTPWLFHKYLLSVDVKVREMLAILCTPNGAPAFTEAGSIVATNNGPALQTKDGRMVPPCGTGWGLMSATQAEEFRKRWNL